VAVAGVTAIDINVAAGTVKVAEPVLPPKLAVMTDVPTATPVAMPDVLLTVATPVVPEVQLEDAVTSLDVPSAYVAIATNCWGAPIGIEAVAGVTAIDADWGGNQCPVSAPPPPHPEMKKTHRIEINTRYVYRALNLFIPIPLFCFNDEHTLVVFPVLTIAKRIFSHSHIFHIRSLFDEVLL
jgi:hypothetical protein